MIGRLLRGGFMTAIYAYLYIPIIILIVNSFNSSRFGINWQGFTTNWYSLLMNNDSLLQAAQHSLTMAVLSPDIVMAISLLVLFMLIGIQLGFWSLLFSHITFCLPFVVVTVFSRLKGFDVRMLEAAKDLGASELTILRKIILPLALPAVAAGWLLSFTLSMDDVVVSSFVTGPGYEILPLKIYSMVKVGVSPEVNALATILLVLSQFTKETGIKVIYSTYESNETMYAKLKTYKDGAYDLVVPSTYFVDKMRKEGMLQKIDKSKLSNFSNLDPEMLNKPFDPNNDYSIPYIWGATAIGVNSEEIDPKTVTSWADLWKPEYKSSLLLTDDAREVFQVALRKLGYSGNTTDPKEIEAAYNELKKLMPNVAAFNSDNPANPYMEGEVNLGMVWNGSAWVARQAGTPLEVVWPKEGGIFWMDSLSIPANAKNVDGALKLINFLLRPEVAKQVAETIGYPTPNLAARKMLSPEVANDKSLYPDAATIQKGEWQNDVGSASTLYEEYYQKLKAGR